MVKIRFKKIDIRKNNTIKIHWHNEMVKNIIGEKIDKIKTFTYLYL